MRLWMFLVVHQIKKGQWMSLLTLAWPVGAVMVGVPFYVWVPQIVFVLGLFFAGALLDKPLYQGHMPALWKHLPASDAELDRINTAHDFQRMNDDIGEPYWPEGSA